MAIKLAVNVSAAQLLQPCFVDCVRKTVEESELPFHRLELEIVESSFIEDFEIANQAITCLRNLGIQIALDDFGTGYSSLTYLRRLALDKIKIDQSFVAGVDTVQSAAIVQAVVALGRALGFKITAERVEILDPSALNGLLEMSNGDTKIVERVTRLYCDHAPMRLAELRDALSREDFKRVASAAHALQSMSLNIGACAVAETAANLEKLAHNETPNLTASMIEEFATLATNTCALLAQKAAQ
jgi:HPt (histidine-containing phosphotransfer) domain-containing protein